MRRVIRLMNETTFQILDEAMGVLQSMARRRHRLGQGKVRPTTQRWGE